MSVAERPDAEDQEEFEQSEAGEAEFEAEEVEAAPVYQRCLIAVVGRPNVGKSTLFNRLIGERLAIVHDAPGVTRDRNYADAVIGGRSVTVVDTGGFDPTTDDPMGQGIARHVIAAIAEADLVLCVLDGVNSPTQADADAIKLLRRADKPVLYCANKVDSQKHEAEITELYRLGVDRLYPVSALHGRGLGELELAMRTALPAPVVLETGAGADDEVPRVALLGRPNAGKSSLFNRLSGSERSLVDDRPGTTRDAVDSEVEIAGHRYWLIDTAGIRKKAKVQEEVESASVMRSIKAAGRADIVILMCDASEGIGDQEQRLLGLCAERGRGIVVGLNKSDLLTAAQRKAAVQQAEEKLGFARWAKVMLLSAKTGNGVDALMKQARRTHRELHRRIPTAELNRFFESVLERRPPPTAGGKAPRLYYVTQAQTNPPLFVAMSNAPEAINDGYRRFVMNQLRKTFGFDSVPIKIAFRKRSRRGER
ncbi:MAG: ribosome biogenesis GTPase Der [Polyangiaceae bacterium]